MSSRDSSPHFNNNFERNRTYSPVIPRLTRFRSEESVLNSSLNPNSTYTLPFSRSRSHDSQIKARCARIMNRLDPATMYTHLHPHQISPPSACIQDHMIRPMSSFECDSELLEEKLNETETHINRIVHQLTLMKDFLILETSVPPHVLPNVDLIISRYELDRNKLLGQLDLFEFANRDLRDIIHILKSHKSVNDIRHTQENSALLKQIEALEKENNVNNFFL